MGMVSAENPDNVTLADEGVSIGETPGDAVQSTDDVLAGDGDEINYKSFSEVQQQINNANAGDTIYVSGVYKGTGTQITINKALTIEGVESEDSANEYAYFDADGLSRIFSVTASDVVLKNLVIRNGNAGYNDGGAVYCDAEDNCLIDHCIIGLCEADYGGATYYCDAINSMFLANSADTYGGAMYGGSALSCGFANNTAGEDGGAVYVKGSAVFSGCYFENNTADDDGGAICNDGNELTVLDSDFRFNEASDDGGAIYTYGSGETYVENGYFWMNEAGYWGGAMCRGVARSSSFYMNSADINGGGMYDGEAYDCSFSFNSPQNAYGTSVYRTIIGKITLSQSGSYFGGKTVSAKVVDTNDNNAPLANVAVTFKFSNGKSATVYTGSNGVATYNVPFNPGTYKVTATIPASYSASAATLSNVNIAKASAKLSPTKLTTNFGTCKTFKVKVINTKTNKGIAGVKLLLKVYTGKKAKKVHVTTGSNGVAQYTADKLKVGSHKVKVSVESSAVSAKSKSSKIVVKKASSNIWAPEGLYVYKKDNKFYMTVYNKHTGKIIKGAKLKVKVYTGKKAKTYNVKVKKDGYAILKTKSLKVGKHKVVITFNGDKNFKKSSIKTSIEISKKIPTRVGYSLILTTYSYGFVSGRIIYPYVKDLNGNTLSHKKVTLIHSSGAQTTGYTGDGIRMPGGSYGSVTIKFAGDRNYMPSQFVIRFA